MKSELTPTALLRLSVAMGVAACAFWAAWAADETGVPGYNQRQELYNLGEKTYQKYCIGCHGEHGDGAGPASPRLIVKPRDFTSGVFKFRSTRSGQLPTEGDLYRTITQGVHRTSMPAFPLVPEREKLAVIEYLKGFSPAWEAPNLEREIVPIPSAPSDLGSEPRVIRGKALYFVMGCFQCHGDTGGGDGPAAAGLTDTWGNAIKPFNFARGALKSGADPEDIYRTFNTGVNGTPMPDYGPAFAAFTKPSFEGVRQYENRFTEEELAELRKAVEALPEPDQISQQASLEERSWDLVAFILSLRKGGGLE